jgi:D-alanine-D-alanine ligase
MKKFCLLFGGRSTEYDASLLSYLNIIESILSEKPEDIKIKYSVFIDGKGYFFVHSYDKSNKFPRSELEFNKGDKYELAYLSKFLKDSNCFIFSLLHGNEGEDGAFQGYAEILDLFGNFDSAFCASVSMHKWTQSLIANAICSFITPILTEIVPTNNIPTNRLESILKIFEKKPVIIKPNSLGASLFISTIDCLNLDNLKQKIKEISNFDNYILIQERIIGREFTCGCIMTPSGIQVLPIIEALTEEKFLGHYEKHNRGKITSQFFTNTNDPLFHKITDTTKKLFEFMQCKFMCRYDFIVDNNENLYFLEANLLPGIMKSSSFYYMLKKAGYNISDILRFSYYGTSNMVEKSYRYTISV